MTDHEFRNILTAAIQGDMDALANIVELYLPLIDRYSWVHGKLDEDLRQEILLELCKSIVRFKI